MNVFFKTTSLPKRTTRLSGLVGTSLSVKFISPVIMKIALSILLLSYLVFCASAQTTQSQERLLELPLLTVQGFGTRFLSFPPYSFFSSFSFVFLSSSHLQSIGNWFVTSNTTTLTVTLYGFGPNATSAQLAVQQQLQYLQNTLSNVTVSLTLLR